jgi:hypothetical protein
MMTHRTKTNSNYPTGIIVDTTHTLMALGIIAAMLLSPQQAEAVEFNGSGFLTLAAGKMLHSETADAFIVTDYGQGGIYDKGDGWSIGPDSKLGLQGVATFDPQWSATAQLVSRGARDGKVDLEWLYATYQASDDVTLQFGRKRLPLFYYSEAQDIGIALPWVRLPAPAYGWDVVNFNGANLIHRGNLGDWNSSAAFFYGNETRRNNPYQQIYHGRGTDWDEKWNDIYGADWTLSRDWLELRLSYVHSGLEYWDTANKANTYTSTKQSFYSIAAAVDRDNWIVRAEVSKVDRPGFAEHDEVYLLGIGYRLGKWLPMATFARFHGNYTNGSPNERFDDLAFSLRYDLTSSTALKLQYDLFNDRSDVGITCYQDPANCASGSQRYGDSRLLSIAYDRVF